MMKAVRRICCLLALVLTCLATVHVPGAAGAAQGHLNSARSAAPHLVGPKTYYLALGDGLAFGFQPDRNFNRGYASGFFANLRPLGTTTLIDMGCPGETLETFMGNGQCPFPPSLLKYQYQGPQLQAALSFIQQHPGQVSPVTIDIGAADVLQFVDPTTCAIITPTGGITQAIQQFDDNVTSILTQLQAALGGTGDVLTMNYYFPYQNLCYRILGGNTPPFQSLMALIEELNAHAQGDAEQAGVPWVDVFSALGGASTPDPTLCIATWVCSGSGTQYTYPNTEGYAIIAQGFEQLYGTAPALALSTGQAVVGQTIAVTGTHFAADKPVNLYWDSTASTPLTTTTTALDGSFSATVTIPPTTGGAHTLVAAGQARQPQARAGIAVAPALTLTPTSGQIGTPVQVTGTGFGAGEPIAVSWNSATGPQLGTTTSDAFGGFSGATAVTFTVPLGLLGIHEVVAIGQSSGLQAEAPFKVTLSSSSPEAATTASR